MSRNLLFKEDFFYIFSTLEAVNKLCINAGWLIYSNKKETSDFHGTVSFDPVKMLQQK